MIDGPGCASDPPFPTSLSDDTGDNAPAVLVVDLNAVRANYRLLAETAAPARCAAAVKADAYGMGLVPVSRALAEAGCDTFFVENTGEGATLRAALPEAVIYVLKGYYAETPEAYLEHSLAPVLVTADQVTRWLEVIAAHGPRRSILKVNTGMNRLGLGPAEARALAADKAKLQALSADYLMSHLAYSEDPDHPMNGAQRRTFEQIRALFPGLPATLAGSGGVMMGADYHYSMVRPGVGLYGGNPFAARANPFAEVFHLKGKILQVREIDRGESVGYGATHVAPAAARIAILGIGYADGYGRCFDNRGKGVLNGIEAPVVGRVSMGSVAVDVSECAPENVSVGDYVTLIGGRFSLDDAARVSGQACYALLTALSQCKSRRYIGSAGAE